ncbi:hypothetical protein PHLGIDRAFT_123851 [Phlebiopsis gigantea 11061_1 CR5-6]|uniref:CASTOR ACT domain-containing protein n=1 Tax=Phlebiopsis gigantea (strain 11061_1 CR5-6) TaxID=745531 RepID=A0A0C3SFW1_PHLG1|nr:hypothetical protein PHLGIDRAFT_123851 [Phlebiopsis gigantea 11061_1 CR5-6]
MASSATISLLPVSLSLVHIPRSRIKDQVHPLLRQLLLPSPTFLNVTSNEIEISVFAEHYTLQDFEFSAQQDALNKSSSRERPSLRNERRKHSAQREWDPIEVSHERWNVLQIDSHFDGLDTSGARVHELSAPLAAAGISILYQSSYMSDFIFVKEHRLAEVMSLLGTSGFDLYQSDPDNLTSQLSRLTSPILSPLTHAEEDDVSIHLLDLSAALPISPEAGAVLTRSRSSTDASVKSAFSSPVYTRNDVDSPMEDNTAGLSKDPKSALTRSHSHSPSGSDVRVLDPDLTCIGLSDDSVDIWALKIVKLVAFPDLVCPTQNGLATPSPPKPSFGAPETSDPLTQSEGESDSTARFDDSLTDDECRASSESPIFDPDEGKTWEDAKYDDAESSEDEESASNSPEAQRTPLLNLDSEKTTMSHLRPKRHAARRSSRMLQPPPEPPLVPFFSFTRTPEGSSLTAPVDVLASLFPPSERHMVICSGELDVLDSRAGSPVDIEAEELYDVDESSDQTFVLPETEGTLRCLQIDLRKFGLDKHGLITRYSRTLEENGINHLYSSTYKSANLLVDKAHARRAQALLRSC